MTTVHVSMARDDGTSTTAATGVLVWEPTTRRESGDDVVLPQGFTVALSSGEATVTVAPSGLTWCWRVTERVQDGTVRYVSVPDSATTVEYVDLPDVDPDTLVAWTPADPEAAYLAALAGLDVASAVETYLLANPPAASPDADAATKGILKLAGDLGGTADLPTVPGLADKANTADLGTAAAADTGDFVATADLTVTAGASISGANTGDQDLSGLVPTSRTVNSKPLSANVTLTASDVGAATPQQVTDGDTATLSAAQSHAQALVDALTAASPATLDTLAEIADALGDDPNFAATITAALAARVRFDAAQSLTVSEQAQARSNIGAGTSSFSGAYADLTGKPTLGTAAATASTDYATAAQGAKADTALQPATGQTINAQTTAYTLVAADAGKLVQMTLATAADLTVPANVFTAGQRVDIADRGTARVTVVAGSGMTVNPPAGGSLVMEGQYAYASLVFISATEADLVGLVAAS